MPALIVVSGAPASGKTTLSRRIRDQTGLPLLEKDGLKEALSDAVGHPSDVAASIRLGAASYAALFTLGRMHLVDGLSVVLESNFRRGVSEIELAPLAALASCLRLIHCTASDEVLATRYRSRAERGLRHPSHLDDQRHDALRADLANGLFAPLDVDWPLLVVRTDSGYEPSLGHILNFAAPDPRREVG